MTKQDLHLQEVKSEQDLMAFIRFLWEATGDRYWAPSIKGQLSKSSPSHIPLELIRNNSSCKVPCKKE